MTLFANCLCNYDQFFFFSRGSTLKCIFKLIIKPIVLIFKLSLTPWSYCFPFARPYKMQWKIHLSENGLNDLFIFRCANCVENMNDFCYLCYQRERRNVPIYYTEERKKEEEEDDHLLQMYTLLKDKEAFKREEVSISMSRRSSVVVLNDCTKLLLHAFRVYFLLCLEDSALRRLQLVVLLYSRPFVL